MIIFRSIQVATYGIVSFFLWLIRILFCICTTSSYPFGSGHLSCFHILGIVTSSALSFQLTAFSQYMSRSGIAWSWGSLIFKEPSSCFPYWVHQFTFPKTVFKFFFFSTTLPTFMCVLWDDGSFGTCEGVTSVCVDLHFFDDYIFKASFPVPVCHLYIFFGKNVY